MISLPLPVVVCSMVSMSSPFPAHYFQNPLYASFMCIAVLGNFCSAGFSGHFPSPPFSASQYFVELFPFCLCFWDATEDIFLQHMTTPSFLFLLYQDFSISKCSQKLGFKCYVYTSTENPKFHPQPLLFLESEDTHSISGQNLHLLRSISKLICSEFISHHDPLICFFLRFSISDMTPTFTSGTVKIPWSPPWPCVSHSFHQI